MGRDPHSSSSTPLVGKIRDIHIRLIVVSLTGRKLALRYVLFVGHHPPASTSRPCDVIDMVSVPKVSLFFTTCYVSVACMYVEMYATC